MLRRYLFGGLVALALAATSLLLLPETSYAQRRGGWGGYRGGYSSGYRGGWGGSYGSYRGYYGGYSPYWGSGLYLGFGSYGPRSYGYGSGYGYPYAYSSYYAPSYSYYRPSYTYAAPSYPYSYPAYSSAYGGTTQSYQSFYPPDNSSDNSVHVQVNVPMPDAEVWFEGSPTQQRGTTREFDSPELAPGRIYTYHIRARWQDSGQMRDETRAVKVQPGQTVTVDFTLPDNSATTPGARREELSLPAAPAANPVTPAVPPASRRPVEQPPQENLQAPAPAPRPNAAPSTGVIGPDGRVVPPTPKQ